MKSSNLIKAGVVIGAIALALTGCSSSTTASTATSSSAGPDYSTLSGTITAGGSSAQANAQTAWTAAFTQKATNVKVNYDKSQGSGGGVTNWLAGSYDFAGSDAALSTDNAAKAKTSFGADALNLPIYLDGVSIIYNLPGVTTLKLSSANIAKIFAGAITTWNDPAIAADNSGVTLPSTKITAVVRSDGSGTTQNFTNYLVGVQPTIWTWPAGNKFPTDSKATLSAQQGGSGVVNTVKSTEGSIGYADHSAIGTQSAASIQVGTGSDFVAFSQDAVTATFAAAGVRVDTGIANDLTYKFDYSKITTASQYPIPLLSYAVVSSKFKDATQASLTKAYLGYIASDEGQKVAKANAGSAPLPADILTKVQASISSIN